MSLETMQQRLNYKGGVKPQERMIADKLWSLRSAIKRSYQAVTIETSKGKRFRCLLNPDNLKPDYDMKILSIPYQNIDLNDTRKQRTSEGYVDIEMDGGEVFTCLDDGTKWIIYMKHLNEKAYLRAECRLWMVMCPLIMLFWIVILPLQVLIPQLVMLQRQIILLLAL